MYKFEKNVIDVLLNTIKEHQVYLTQPENLPQLAKLGYIYNVLWYGGRVCYGYKGILHKSENGECENNAKYKIEMCNPQTRKIQSLIYGAWGMHVGCNDEEDEQPSWEKFNEIVFGNTELSGYDILFKKQDKTMDEWVELLTSKNYIYSYVYPNRQIVIEDLICSIGCGYDYKNGYIIYNSCCDDEDITQYGEWENAVFRDDIKDVITEILSIPEVKTVVQESNLYFKSILEKKKTEKEISDMEIYGMSYQEYLKTDKGIKQYNKMFNIDNGYRPYDEICEFSTITKFDSDTHPSYIEAGLEVCENILKHQDQESDTNITFAIKFYNKFKK